ncbi:Sensor histidine kinase TodS [compost metagenome]
MNSLYQDSKGTFWFCTEGGLIHYEPSTGKTKNYTVENGLSVNQVFKVLEDNSGLLWISTSKGLCRFNPKTETFTIYHTPNGLPTEQFNYNSALKNDDGTLFFGTVKGLISFNPSDFIRNSYVPPIYITGIQVNNNEVTINPTNSPLKQSQIYPTSITLPYDQSNISIDVAALSFIIPEMNAYQYKLEGLDKNWVDLKNNRKIYFTKLPPGNYTFKVKGSNSEGIWNKKEATLKINILPPFWATIWAYLIYAIIIGAVIFTIFRYYYLAISEKSKRQIAALEINKEREIYNAKIDFFTNVTHEIRTPLTLIKMPLDKLIAQKIDDGEINESLEMMNKNTNRLIDLTNQLLDFRKAEANNFSLSFTDNNINNLLNEVFEQFRPVAEQKQLHYKLEMPRIVLHAYTDNEALRKIISNLINNAIKYSSQKVLVKLLAFSSEDLLFHIEVINDGFIIPNELGEKIFEPFFRIKETDKEAGTGIGLSLAKSLAELHNGKLGLKHTSNDTNTFLLSLPIHQETEINLRNYEDKTESIVEPAANKEMDKSKSLILIVEDNVEILNYLSKELSTDYNIVHALNGLEAIDVLQKENVQLVISDIMMPLMDGIELCRHLKSDLQFSHIPIVLLTAKNSLNSKIEGLEVGADAYIEKPFSLDHLVAQMNNLLMNRTIIKDYFSRSPLSHVKGISFSKADKAFIDQLNQVIYQHITDMDLDVETLSRMMNMSKPTLYRKIKALSDLTPNELINLTRLKKGAELLAEGNYKINEVADLIGYTLSSNFSRDFQKQFGISPSQFIGNLKKEG